MYCQNKIVHMVQEGDSLYKLSRHYQTTVTELIMGNPGVNPYNLQIGMRLMVCPGPGYDMQENGNMTGDNTRADGRNWENTNTGMRGGTGSNMPGVGSGMPGTENNMPETGNNMPGAGSGMRPGASDNETEEKIMEAMRLAWLSHVYWDRMVLTAIETDAPDLQAVEERTLKTADEIADVFGRVLSTSATRQLRNLLLEHVEIAGNIIQALKADKMEDYDGLIKAWYANANQIAALLAAQSPYFAGRETRTMLLNHLDLLREVVEQQLKGEYEKSIRTFDEFVRQAVEMADYFSKGLMKKA
jgi:hypothetical protein